MNNIIPSRRRAIATLLLASLASTVSTVHGRCDDAAAPVEDALVRLAAERLDSVFQAVADSTRALGDTYARLALEQRAQPTPDSERWLARRTTRGGTTGLRSWPEELNTPPQFQEPYAGFYSYNGSNLSDAVLGQLDLFERLVPTFRTAYESFPFSWVYVTTVDEAMMIYPYLPIEQAVNNGPPTQTPYFRAADFDRRAVGWTQPYLDLVGAGMMITASYPVYDGGTLLGVVSRDITLAQLAKSVMSHLNTGNHSIALLVDRNGLAIDASDPGLAAEIERVNAAADAAVLYYRGAGGLQTLNTKGAVASSYAAINALVEQVLAESHAGHTVRLDLEGRRVLMAPVRHTGWILILIQPD